MLIPAVDDALFVRCDAFEQTVQIFCRNAAVIMCNDGIARWWNPNFCGVWCCYAFTNMYVYRFIIFVRAEKETVTE